MAAVNLWLLSCIAVVVEDSKECVEPINPVAKAITPYTTKNTRINKSIKTSFLY
jgi:hypothetical protein